MEDLGRLIEQWEDGVMSSRQKDLLITLLLEEIDNLKEREVLAGEEGDW